MSSARSQQLQGMARRVEVDVSTVPVPVHVCAFVPVPVPVVLPSPVDTHEDVVHVAVADRYILL